MGWVLDVSKFDMKVIANHIKLVLGIEKEFGL